MSTDPPTARVRHAAAWPAVLMQGVIEMPSVAPNSKKLVGAVVATILAIAVYYGYVSQQTANSIQNQTDQTLGTRPVTQQPGPQPPPPSPMPSGPITQTPPTSTGAMKVDGHSREP